MGDVTNILCTLGLSDNEKKVYKTVKRKFEEHFVECRNINLQTCKVQLQATEKKAYASFDSFITDLHCLVKHCNYGELQSEMIQDKIVVGLLDVNLSMKLQMDPELTLEKATTATRQSEVNTSHPILM